jgi:hypothetical protein
MLIAGGAPSMGAGASRATFTSTDARATPRWSLPFAARGIRGQFHRCAPLGRQALSRV